MNARESWDRAAAGWDAFTPAIHAWLAVPTQAMLAMAGIAPGARVLDVAAGAGNQTLDVARRVGPAGFVLATDVSPVILDCAQRRVAATGHPNVATRVADAEQLPDDLEGFDAAICRLGLMLMAEPLAALQGMRRALRDGGGICTLVFGAPARNPAVALLMKTAAGHAGLPAPEPSRPGGLFSLSDPARLDALFAAAGFRDIATTAIDAPFHWPSARHYVDFIKASAGPVQASLARLDATAQEAAWQDITARLGAFETVDGFVAPHELLLTAARR